MSTVRPITYVTPEQLQEFEDRVAQHFEALENRLILHEAVIGQILEFVDEAEVEDVEETTFEDDEEVLAEEGFEIDILQATVPPEHQPDEDALAAQREARRLQKEAAGAEAKAAAAVAPVTLDETPPAAAPVQALDPVEAANQVQVGEEGVTVE